MRIAILLFIFMAPLVGCQQTPSQTVDWSRLVDSIAMVECGVPWKLGGVMCWTKAAWMEETNLDWGYSVDYNISRILAISRLANQARTNNRKTINEIATLWNKGPNGPRTSDYGQRVENLYYDK